MFILIQLIVFWPNKRGRVCNLLNEDKVFLAQQKDSEHIRVFRRLISEYKTVMIGAIAGAKDMHQLAIAQGVIRGMNALEHTLTTQIVLGETMIKDAEKVK